MTKKLWIAVLLAATTLGSTAYAHGGGDQGWRDGRHDRWMHERHDGWGHDHWRHRHHRHDRDHWRYDYRPAPQHYYYQQPGVHLPLPPLPPSPHEIHHAIRDAVRGLH